jgi:arsenate reductase-like glutaredoxin family protein
MEKEQPTVSIEPAAEWTVEHEKILIEWADKAMCYRWLHTRANSLYAYLNACYTIPCIIISTLAGTANFAQQRIPVAYQPLFTMLVGGVNILGGIISTIQQFLKITQLNEAHRVSSISWDKFYRNIKIELAKHPLERIAVIHMLKMSKEEFDRLMETSPMIPDKIINEFQKKFKNNDDFQRISKPEICDVLVSTDSFRNPWYNEENREKRAAELKQIQQTIENRKHELEEKNKNTVSNFKRTFINLNHREPTDNEIITNLQDTMDLETICEIIEELRNNTNTNNIAISDIKNNSVVIAMDIVKKQTNNGENQV